MIDGKYIRGYLVSYSPRVPEDDQRELILTRAEVRQAKGVTLQPIGSTLTVVPAKQIARLDVTYINKDAEPRPVTPSANDPGQEGQGG